MISQCCEAWCQSFTLTCKGEESPSWFRDKKNKNKKGKSLNFGYDKILWLQQLDLIDEDSVTYGGPEGVQ